MDITTALAEQFLSQWSGGKEEIWDAYFGRPTDVRENVRVQLSSLSAAELGTIIGVGRNPENTVPARRIHRHYGVGLALTYMDALRGMAADVLIDKMAEILRERGDTSLIVREEQVGN